ncbi:hypothetical protein V8F20_003242 [Naviculisporaceae sp. PSN 640]
MCDSDLWVQGEDDSGPWDHDSWWAPDDDDVTWESEVDGDCEVDRMYINGPTADTTAANAVSDPPPVGPNASNPLVRLPNELKHLITAHFTPGDFIKLGATCSSLWPFCIEMAFDRALKPPRVPPVDPGPRFPGGALRSVRLRPEERWKRLSFFERILQTALKYQSTSLLSQVQDWYFQRKMEFQINKPFQRRPDSRQEFTLLERAVQERDQKMAEWLLVHGA